MNEKEIANYVELAMKNLHFAKVQRENVISEVTRLLHTKSTEEVKQRLKNN
ncbi:hypothetical protein [Enterococcus sp. AZ194]|uniref:hypothetical protein n=1 Tax=Enterococcus sp. AZ194 TaxID=2774629 RepID=UPI003F683FF9